MIKLSVNKVTIFQSLNHISFYVEIFDCIQCLNKIHQCLILIDIYKIIMQLGLV